MRALLFAIRTLTRLPIGSTPLTEEERSLLWFPLVGVIYGALGLVIALIPTTAAVRAALIIAGWAYLNRGFHLDGLADFADGLGGGWKAEESLRIMRDSHIGAFGVITLITVLLIQWTTLTSLTDALPALLFTPFISRVMLALAASTMPYAREGQGSASALVGRSTWRHALLPLLQALVVLLALAYWGSFTLALAALASTIGALSTTLCVLGVAKRRIGGVTGDVLGAVLTLAETGALLGFLLAL